jgi:hypothetical protein
MNQYITVLERVLLTAGPIAAALLFSTSTYAITVTQNTNALSLADMLDASGAGLTVTGATLSGHTSAGAASSGTYTNVSGIYGIGPGIILSTGNVSDYGDGPNTDDLRTTFYGTSGEPATAAQEALLDPITGGSFNHFDVTQLDINFDSTSGTVFFAVVFASEEYPEFVGSDFIDGYGFYLNGVNIALVGGQPVNINHPDMTALTGTEFDGVLAPGGNPVLLFSGPALPTGNTLTFIAADTSDAVLDSAVYITSLSGENPVPLPPAVWLLGSGMAGLIGLGRRRATGKFTARND